MALPTKQQVQEKLLDYPLLRQLVYERWFRLAFAAFALIFVFLALFLPKIWRASRAGFNPVIKVSGLDLVQAWSLKRTAVKSMAAGKFEEANYAWQAALANNRADPALVRGALGSLLQDRYSRKYSTAALQEAFWLLKLTGTNLTDLQLTARIFERYKYFEPIVSLVQPHLDQVQAPLAALYLKALFSQGQIEPEFNRRWQRLTQRLPDLQNDPELRLFRDAYLIGWGAHDSGSSDARADLEAATADPKRRVIAYQLQLALSSHQMNSEEYGRVLKKLEDIREDTLAVQIVYWGLLAETGHKPEAVELLKSYPNPPTSPIEGVELAELYAKLGLPQEGLQLLRRYVTEFGNSPVYWVTEANLLVESKQWDEVRNLAFQIRGQEQVHDSLLAFSYFLEGRSELVVGGKARARAAFEKAADRDCPYQGLSLKMAAQLIQFGHGDLAQQILGRLEKPLGERLNYWLLVFNAADLQKDVDMLLKSATHAYQLAPNDLTVINNYAAALIINRQNPEQVIKLTVQLLSANPGSLYAKVNHSAALLLNDRPREAERLLSQVSTNTLNRAQLALYNLDLFETYSSLQQYDRAWSVSDRIEPDLLYPTQRKWLENSRQKLPPRQKQG